MPSSPSSAAGRRGASSSRRSDARRRLTTRSNARSSGAARGRARPTTASRSQSSRGWDHRAVYRWVDHTAEVELEIEADSEREVFADALVALADLLGTAGEGNEPRAIELNAADRPALLAAWLEELVFLAETEGFEPLSLEALELD